MLLFFLAATVTLECNKTGGLNTNIAHVSVIHTAIGEGQLDFAQQKDSNNSPYTSILASPISYGTSSGSVSEEDSPGTAKYLSGYRNAEVGVSGVRIWAGDAKTVVSTGNTTFSNGRYYSVFLYDSAATDTVVPLIILPDNIITSVDTFAYLRWMNFCPGTYYNIRITSLRPQADITGIIRDSIPSGFLPFVGNSEKISTYSFKRVHSGRYKVTAYKSVIKNAAKTADSLINPVTITDSLILLRDISYTALLQGFEDSTGEKHTRLRVIEHLK